MKIPDAKNVFEIIYKYKGPGDIVREFYLEKEDVKKFMAQLGSASIMGVTHGMTFEPLNWKVRRI